MKRESEDIMDVDKQLDIDIDLAEYLRNNPNEYNKYLKERIT